MAHPNVYRYTVVVEGFLNVKFGGPVSCGLISNYLGYILMYGWRQ